MKTKIKKNVPATPVHINMTYAGVGEIDPKKVNVALPFQRDIEKYRVNYLTKSYDKMGMYDYAKPIVIDQNDAAVDGKHRIDLAIGKGLKIIPFTRYNFATDIDRVKYFHLAQEHPRGMKARDELFAYKLSQHAYADLLYAICQNKKSLISTCHDLKTKPGSKMTSDAIKVENLCYILNHVVLGKKSGWSRSYADDLHIKSQAHLTTKIILEDCKKMDDFLTFFCNSTGWTIAKKDLRFREHFLLGFIELYTDVLIPDSRFESEKYKIQNKLASFKISKDVVTNHKDVIQLMLLKHINKRRKPENCYV